jgi:hypothetical protein
MKELSKCNQDLRKRNKTLQKRLERLKRKTQTNSPRSKANQLMNEARFSTSQTKKIRKQLVMGNAVLEEIKKSSQVIQGKRKGKVRTLSSIISGRILKKYRGRNWLKNQTGIARGHMIVNGNEKWKQKTAFKRNRTSKIYALEVRQFLEREDNSRCKPGKADMKRSENKTQQTKVLTDYLANLHMKFVSENPAIKMSLATFCRMRPKHILPTTFISRSTCLCTKHQNMALVLKSLRKEGVKVSANPEEYAKGNDIETPELENKLPEKVLFGQCKRVETTDKGKKKNGHQSCRSRHGKERVYYIFVKPVKGVQRACQKGTYPV